jgi:hypothetical protein
MPQATKMVRNYALDVGTMKPIVSCLRIITNASITPSTNMSVTFRGKNCFLIFVLACVVGAVFIIHKRTSSRKFLLGLDMPQQPLSSVAPNASLTIGHAGGDWVFVKHPELAMFVAQAIASWSNVESFLLNLSVELMGRPKDTATTVYLALDTQGAKAKAVTAVAAVKLPKEQQALLRAILAIARSVQKSRDKIAHGTWGVSPDLPDALLLADPKTLVGDERPDYRDIYVYKKQDFVDIINACDRICGYGLRLAFILKGHVANARGELFRELCAEPEIVERLRRPASQD